MEPTLVDAVFLVVLADSVLVFMILLTWLLLRD